MNDEKVDYGEVIIDGRLISASWWGQMWCKNIENYSNLKNRLERGRTYIRKNTIKSFSISDNKIEASVQGTMKNPYEVSIMVKSISTMNYNNILDTFENSIDNMESLFSGTFPEEYKKLFMDEKYGLFPKSSEISYYCSCPDFETNEHMCKHIAATLYAVGNKLDKNPLIFFKLRGINIDEFANAIIKKENEFVWDKINISSDRKIDNKDIKLLFGIDYEDDDDIIDSHKILNISKSELSPKSEKETNGIIQEEILKKEEDFEIDDIVNIMREKSEEMNKKINSYNNTNKRIETDKVIDKPKEMNVSDVKKQDNTLNKKLSNNIFFKLFKYLMKK